MRARRCSPNRLGSRERTASCVLRLLCHQKGCLLLVLYCVALHLFCQLNQARGNRIARQCGCNTSGFASEVSEAARPRAAEFRGKSHSFLSQYGGAMMTMRTANADLRVCPSAQMPTGAQEVTRKRAGPEHSIGYRCQQRPSANAPTLRVP